MVKAEIISSLSDDNKKIELLNRFPDTRETIVIASFDSDEKKIELLNKQKYEGDKSLIIQSLKNEKIKIQLLETLSDYAKSCVILSIDQLRLCDQTLLAPTVPTYCYSTLLSYHTTHILKRLNTSHYLTKPIFQQNRLRHH